MTADPSGYVRRSGNKYSMDDLMGFSSTKAEIVKFKRVSKHEFSIKGLGDLK